MPNKETKRIIKRGMQIMQRKKLSICTIVRDCEKTLPHLIKKIENLRKLFADSEVIVFENDSIDRSLEILHDWRENSINIILMSEKYNEVTISSCNLISNPFFSRYRIERMTRYRNKYMEILNRNDFKRDYVIVLDMDIADFSLNGIAHSFGINQKWGCLTANGTSLSRSFSRQYHDSYALIEKGSDNFPLNEFTIMENRKRYSFIKTGMPLISVDSAFGGLAIYKWENMKGLYYSCIPNNNEQVEVLCEHVSINRNLNSDIFINPELMVKIRKMTFKFLFDKFNTHYKIRPNF